MPLLLHSLTFYSDLIADLAKVVPNPSVVEVGSEHGHMSDLLARITAERGGSLYVIEPHPAPKLEALLAAHTNVSVVSGLSPAALVDAPRAGLYLLDGDHNYYVVLKELEAVFDGSPTELPLVLLHDVGWPCARRDLYYDPSALPPAEVRPHSWTRGAVPGRSELAPEGRGYRGKGAFALALEEGGERNGVLSALEDFLKTRSDLHALITPLVFGVAVVGPGGAPWWSQVADLMRPYVENPTLEAMEQNRLELFVETIDQADSHWRARVRRLLRHDQLPLARK